jgi:hypothetical protein
VTYSCDTPPCLPPPQVAVVGSAPVASCGVRLTPSLIFLGSQVGDSLLIQATKEGPAAATAAAAAAAGGGDPPSKRRRLLATLASYDMGGSEGLGDAALRPASFSGTAAAAAAAARGATAAAAGVDFEDGFGGEGEWELYKSATGRSSCMKLHAAAGAAAAAKYSFKVRAVFVGARVGEGGRALFDGVCAGGRGGGGLSV